MLSLGVAERIDFKTMTKEIIKEAVLKVLENPK